MLLVSGVCITCWDCTTCEIVFTGAALLWEIKEENLTAPKLDISDCFISICFGPFDSLIGISSWSWFWFRFSKFSGFSFWFNSWISSLYESGFAFIFIWFWYMANSSGEYWLLFISFCTSTSWLIFSGVWTSTWSYWIGLEEFIATS